MHLRCLCIIHNLNNTLKYCQYITVNTLSSREIPLAGNVKLSPLLFMEYIQAIRNTNITTKIKDADSQYSEHIQLQWYGLGRETSKNNSLTYNFLDTILPQLKFPPSGFPLPWGCEGPPTCKREKLPHETQLPKHLQSFKSCFSKNCLKNKIKRRK